ncbi:MAG: glucoamylase [Nitrospira sp.]
MVNTPTTGLGPTIGSGAMRVQPVMASHRSNLDHLAPYMLMLMMRNMTSDGFVIEDPAQRGVYSLPGCVIAAPSFPANTPGVDQDYVYNWVRDAAITAIEIASADLPTNGGSVQALIDYVNFAATCYNNAIPIDQDEAVTKGHACFTVAGKVRPWTEQSDGPALQTITMLRAYGQLDDATKKTAVDQIEKNLAYLLTAYRQPTTNLWEEHQGDSFFARSVQLRCFREVAENQIGMTIPNEVAEAITWLDNALATHWNGSYYVSLVRPGSQPPQSVFDGYDVNIDIASACVYGAVPCTDPKLLATVAILRQQWSDPNSASVYPINLADKERGIGPLFGRYPKDIYDGDVADPVLGGHPWALCTANVAEVYYSLAGAITSSNKVPFNNVSKTFFEPLGINARTKVAAAAAMLRNAADAMLRAILFHSDHYELSEQFDGASGYEKSVHNLTWSYAALLSALRARNA